jgi:hypothetical protein
MSMGQYVLDENGEPKLEPDILAWARWFEATPQRVVAKTATGRGDVSTVFLGLDHRYQGEGPPVLWETMIFGGKHDQYQERYTSCAAAVEGHQRAVMLARWRWPWLARFMGCFS